ncbi:hypothetical protein AB0758_49050 [Tolypothrix bouteillei VB521301_2]|uniref:hypothetical protein n=1 Tax=Tolypothrix bouteillei TaxID=1246981 RepID=UPI0038B542D9
MKKQESRNNSPGTDRISQYLRSRDSQYYPDTHTGISKPFKFDGNHTVCNVFGWFFDNSMLMSFLGAGSTFFTVVSILRAKTVLYKLSQQLSLLYFFYSFWSSNSGNGRNLASQRLAHLQALGANMTCQE